MSPTSLNVSHHEPSKVNISAPDPKPSESSLHSQELSHSQVRPHQDAHKHTHSYRYTRQRAKKCVCGKSRRKFENSPGFTWILCYQPLYPEVTMVTHLIPSSSLSIVSLCQTFYSLPNSPACISLPHSSSLFVVFLFNLLSCVLCKRFVRHRICR